MQAYIKKLSNKPIGRAALLAILIVFFIISSACCEPLEIYGGKYTLYLRPISKIEIQPSFFAVTV